MPGKPSFDMMSSATGLGHKYQTSNIGYLKTFYTAHSDTWVDHKNYWPEGFKMEHAIGIVNLVHLTEETSLLPTVIILCCMLDKDIVHR